MHIHCPYLGAPQKPGNNECTDIDQACIVSFHYSMPNLNAAPSVPANPTPADTATNVPLTTTVSWGGGDDLTVATNGVFSFATKLADASPYAVTVKTQPSGQTCTVASNSGVIAGAEVTNVAVTCGASSGSSSSLPQIQR